MREVIATGKTVEEATEAGCLELGLSRDEVSVEILEMPTKKLFKSTPAKVKVTADGVEEEAAAPKAEAAATPRAEAAPAREERPAPKPQAAAKPQAEKPAAAPVLKNEPEEAIDLSAAPHVKQAVEYLGSIFAAMGVPGAAITAFKQGDATLLKVESEEISQKIEVRGEVIQALSYLIDRAVNTGVDKKEDEYLRIRLDIAGYRSRRESELIALASRTGSEVARTGRSRTLAPMNPYERLIVHTAISSMEGVTSESIGADTERRVVVKSTGPNATDGDDWKPGRGNGGGRGRNDRGGRSDRGGDRGRGGSRNDRGGNRQGKGGGYGDRDRRGGGGPPRSSTPEREYAEGPRDPDAAPIIPKRRETISDGEDLPLYGKIEL